MLRFCSIVRTQSCTGVYHDLFQRVDCGLKLAERRCEYDNLLVPNALCILV